MTFLEFLTVLRRGGLLIVLIAVAGASAGFGASLLQTKMYTASTDIYVSVHSADSATSSDVAQGSTAAQLKVRTYVDVATTSAVLAPVISQLELNTTPAALATSLRATAGTDTTLLSIAATDESPAEAARIANAVGASLTRLVADQLEKSSGGPSLVSLETIQEATAPLSPSSPRIVLNSCLGLLVGLLLGFGAALARQRLDTRVRTVDDVATLTTLPVLGSSSFDPKARRRPLVTHTDPHDHRAEAFRSLRTNLQFIDFEAASRSFTITSSNPSEGKTTVAANLAITIADSGASVVLIDGDLRRPQLAERMGLDGTVGLTDVLIGRLELDDVLQPWGGRDLTVLPSGSIPPNPSELLGSLGMSTLIEHLAGRYDYVIVDAPPLLPVTDGAILSRITDGAVVVVASGRTTRVDLESSVTKLRRVESRILGTVVTMVPSHSDSTYSAVYSTDDRQRSQASAPRRIGRSSRA
jgi:capsular exopolysaccharide synthesis family protein